MSSIAIPDLDEADEKWPLATYIVAGIGFAAVVLNVINGIRDYKAGNRIEARIDTIEKDVMMLRERDRVIAEHAGVTTLPGDYTKPEVAA